MSEFCLTPTDRKKVFARPRPPNWKRGYPAQPRSQDHCPLGESFSASLSGFSERGKPLCSIRHSCVGLGEFGGASAHSSASFIVARGVHCEHAGARAFTSEPPPPVQTAFIFQHFK